MTVREELCMRGKVGVYVLERDRKESRVEVYMYNGDMRDLLSCIHPSKISDRQGKDRARPGREVHLQRHKIHQLPFYVTDCFNR